MWKTRETWPLYQLLSFFYNHRRRCLSLLEYVISGWSQKSSPTQIEENYPEKLRKLPFSPRRKDCWCFLPSKIHHSWCQWLSPPPPRICLKWLFGSSSPSERTYRHVGPWRPRNEVKHGGCDRQENLYLKIRISLTFSINTNCFWAKFFYSSSFLAVKNGHCSSRDYISPGDDCTVNLPRICI